MSIYLVLDLLLLLLIALFGPIGYWRGPVKELLVTGGVLFGILLADFWARPWGRDLSDISAIGANGGAFIVAMTFLITVTFVLGYGSGAAIAPANFGTFARSLGAAIALFNGILLVAFSLQYVRVFLLAPSTEEALYDSYVVSFLLDQIGWVLLAVAMVSWPILLGVLIAGRRAYESFDEFESYGYSGDQDFDYVDDTYYQQPVPVPSYDRSTYAPESRTYPPRVPVSQSDESGYVYKAEPVYPAVRPTDATRPIRVGDVPQSPESAFERDHTDPDMSTIPANVEMPREPARQAEPPPREAPSDLAPGYSRCGNCQAVLPPNTRVCPVCGEVN